MIIIVALIASSFVTGFTYQDIHAGRGIGETLYSVQSLPSRIVSALGASLGSDEKGLAPVETYWNVYSYLEHNYYAEEAPDSKELAYSAIRGMLVSLGDRYTRFLDPDEYKQMQEDNRGDFEGIGAELDKRDGRVYIERPIENSPAERAGLKSGDIILKVDDEHIQGLDIMEVVKRIRGNRGTKVKLTIMRPDESEPMDFQIQRAIIPLTIVKSEMKDDENKIGYIALKQFNEKSSQQFETAMKDLESQGMKALILDLRGNPGGLLDVAVDMGSKFIRKGDIVVIQNKGGSRNALEAEPPKFVHPDYPLAVLIDQRSASASEILAGAIKDHGAGTLIGTDTFGKGLVQTIINLEGGAAVSITTAKYLTPSGQDVTKDKIHPDISVEITDEDRKEERDPQLARAVEFLKERLTTSQAKSAPPVGKI